MPRCGRLLLSVTSCWRASRRLKRIRLGGTGGARSPPRCGRRRRRCSRRTGGASRARTRCRRLHPNPPDGQHQRERRAGRERSALAASTQSFVAARWSGVLPGAPESRAGRPRAPRVRVSKRLCWQTAPPARGAMPHKCSGLAAPVSTSLTRSGCRQGVVAGASHRLRIACASSVYPPPA